MTSTGSYLIPCKTGHIIHLLLFIVELQYCNFYFHATQGTSECCVRGFVIKNCLEMIISSNKNVNFSVMCRLLDKVQVENPSWRDSGTAFLTSVTRLLERLLDYRSVIQGDENRDKRMSCTVNLLVNY